MDCGYAVELMSAALDGQCSAAERRALDSHLNICPECADLFRTLSANAAALRELDCQVPDDLTARIMDSLPAQESPAKQGKVIRWKRWAPVAAAACLVLVVALSPGLLPMGAEKNAAPAVSGSAGARDGNTENYGLVSDAVLTPAEAPETPQTYENYGDPGAPAAESTAPVTARAIAVSYGATPAPGAVVVDSPEALADYLAQFGSDRYDGSDRPIPIPELEELMSAYPADFFARRCLVCVVVESGSGSNRYEIVDLSRGTVTVREEVPEVGTCDMAAWLLVAEAEHSFAYGHAPSVEFIR